MEKKLPVRQTISFCVRIEKSNRYAFNKCLSPKTVVITENGEKLLDELEVGDKVLAPKNDLEDEFVEVLDVIDNGIKEVVEVTMEDGKKITWKDGVSALRCIIKYNLFN